MFENLTYSEVLKKNRELLTGFDQLDVQVSVLSNVTMAQMSDFLEYGLRSKKVAASVELGDYDNIVQESARLSTSNVILVFWEAINYLDGLPHKIELMNSKEVTNLLDRFRMEYGLLRNNLKDSRQVLINRFTTLHIERSVGSGSDSNYQAFVDRINEILIEDLPDNFQLIDLDRILTQVGVDQALDFRYYYSSKALYTTDFYKSYAGFVLPIILAAQGKSKKALILDCDNTLWKGVLGEDGMDGIKMSSTQKDGAIFHEIQSIALSLSKKGVLLGLCTKNNPEDIQEVLDEHPDLIIKDEHLSIVKSNWEDKASNLSQIAKELNIGVDSLVFVDDSDFEVSWVREQLPDVSVYQVPKRLSDYPTLMRKAASEFYNPSRTDEDARRVKMYKAQQQRDEHKSSYASMDDYLSSLEIVMRVHLDDQDILTRMSQMTQKTNQFNLTTKRYTEKEIGTFLEDENYSSFAISISDKFGSSGVTGLAIINQRDQNIAEIDTLLMSCRILGRKIEFAFFHYFVAHLRTKGIKTLRARYIPTLKNQQVEDLYDRYGMGLNKVEDNIKYYEMSLDQFQDEPIEFINIEI